ncbi:auxin-responsive protein SAUR32-like [Spinacia oleracea]|uniref:Auxin-responsive protein SAUR32-like n=1 Tax=Spinacia oleracea TaxID=3562 RepID=A0A9R0J0M3_SPIOL|nr:auxin-responsive protein SAUR32-like [Spinacia oleracea]
MGSSERQHMNFHLQLSDLFHRHHRHHHGDNNKKKGVPKGCMAVQVGHEGEEKLERFVIPIMYINHPLFIKLLKEAEEEYGFDQEGLITIPCHVEQFRNVQDVIDREHHRMMNPHHHHHHHRRNNFLCLKA